MAGNKEKVFKIALDSEMNLTAADIHQAVERFLSESGANYSSLKITELDKKEITVPPDSKTHISFLGTSYKQEVYVPPSYPITGMAPYSEDE